MAIFREITKDGYYLRDVEIDDNVSLKLGGAFYIRENWTAPLYKPRWVDNRWVEGIDKTELQIKLDINKLERRITKAKIMIEKIQYIKIKYSEIRRIQLVEHIRKCRKEIKELKNG